MSTFEKRIAVCEWMGLCIYRKDCPCCGTPRTCALHVYHCPDKRCECNCDELPPFTLDWLHECVVRLRKHHPELANKYYSNLHKATKGQSSEIMIDLVEATKEQRLDTLVATLGLSIHPIQQSKPRL